MSNGNNENNGNMGGGNIVTPENFKPSQAKADGMLEIKPKRVPTCMVMSNIKYAERSGKTLYLQMIRPNLPAAEPQTANKTSAEQKPANTATAGKLPLIVFVQGSAWHKQNVFMNIPQLSRFAMRGFAIALAEYRESDIAPFPAQAQDCKTAIRFLRANADQCCIDPDNIALWGDSSGGHTVLMAGISGDGEPDTGDYGEYSCAVNSVVNYYGPVNVGTMREQPSIRDHYSADSPEGYLLGRVPVAEYPDRVKAANPAEYISAQKYCPPVLTMHGDTDMVVPFEQSVIIHEALTAAGKHSEYYKILGADHGTGEFWSEEAFDIVEAFIRKFNK